MSYPSSDAVESQQWFARFDRGQKGHLTIDEIQELLNERGRPIWAPFDQDTGKLIYTVFSICQVAYLEVTRSVHRNLAVCYGVIPVCSTTMRGSIVCGGINNQEGC